MLSANPLRRHRSLLPVVCCGLVLASCAADDPGARAVRSVADEPGTAAVTIPTTMPVDPTTPTVTPTVAPGPAPAVDTTTPAAPDQLVRFAPATFADPTVNGITAFSVLVPEGWQASGSVRWLPLWSRLAFLQTRVNDPVTGVTVDFLPIQDFIWFEAPAGLDTPIGGNYQGKAYVPPITDPAEFVRQFWMPSDLSHLRDAELVSITEVPAVADDFLAQFGGPATASAYRLRYEYLFEGVVWEQDVSFALLFSQSDLLSWYVNFAYTVGAPKGELDRNAGVISTIIASRISTPEWEAGYRLVQQLFRQGIQQQMDDTVAFGELLAQYRAESAALQQQVIDERWASQDRQAEVFREALGGVDTYTDPVNGVLVQLPVGWNTYWVNEAGEYLASDDPGFDPNTMNDGTWQQLEVAVR